MNKQILSALKVSALAIVLSFGISYALAWVAPSVAPPNGNVAAPINTSATAQTKLGSFTIGTTTASSTLTVIGDANMTGDVCTSTTGTVKCLSTAQLQAPIINLTASPATVQNNGSSTLSWTVTNATSCTTVSGPWATTGAKAVPAGSESTGILTNTGGSTYTFTYTLSCTGTGGTVNQNTAVYVLSSGSVTYTGGSGGWVTIPTGVTKVKFKARGGDGGTAISNTYGGGGGGGGSAFAYYGSNIPILSVGGGGGGGMIYDYATGNNPGFGGGAGGYTGGSIYGGGGDGYYHPGVSGSASSGGTGGNADMGSGFSAGAGGTGGVNSSGRGASGGGGSISQDGLYYGNYVPGGGGYLAGGNGGTISSGYYGAGGGGGYAGGGGGGGIYIDNSNGVGTEFAGGGGGSGYLVSGLSLPDINGYVTLLLSTIGSPSQIYLGTGNGGSGYSGWSFGAGGSITMSW